jgi:hypothetical protein
VTVAAKHDMKEGGFKKMKEKLPKRFQKAQNWCHVFVTNHPDNAAELRKKRYKVADDMKISVYTPFLDLALFTFTPEVLKHAKKPGGAS